MIGRTYAYAETSILHPSWETLDTPLSRGLMGHLDLPKELARQCLDRMVNEGHFLKV